MKPKRLIFTDRQVAAALRGEKTQHRIPVPRHDKVTLPLKYAGQLKDGTWMFTDNVPPEKWDSWFPAEYLKGGGVKCPYPVGCEVWVKGTDLRYTVTAVRCQRVQEITAPDVEAEGVAFANMLPAFVPPGADLDKIANAIARHAYSKTWDATHGPDSWDRNDYVWALTLERKPGGGA